MKRAVFIERDAILNEVRTGPKHQITPLTLEEFKVIKAAEPQLKKLKAAGFVLSVTWQEAEAARTAGCTSLLVKSPWVGGVHHDFVLPSLEAIVEKILRLKQHLEFA